ncbi:pentapeptide repeat-containing protein [Streptomyces fimicarius]|uniref:pentapeptide repeat-containing protein n=1 Tax=Streptomyces griseus TaxID=1911 RepID=UPI00368AA67B
MSKRTLRSCLMALGALVGVIIFGLLLWKGPWWFDGAHLRERDLEPADGVVITGFRTALVAVGVAATAAVGLMYTHRNHLTSLALLEHTRRKDRDQTRLTLEGQVTDRYVEAIKLLAAQDPKGGLTERLGGIYALQRVMRDSEKDHDTVVQVLAAFVRQHAPLSSVDEDMAAEDVPPMRDDVQAALTVLGRRPIRIEPEPIDLSYTALLRCDMSFGRFRSVNFRGAEFFRGNLADADLRGAQLGGANLRGANLDRTDLRGADLKDRSNEAQLTVVGLLRAVFDQTTLLPRQVSQHRLVLERLSGQAPDGQEPGVGGEGAVTGE